MLSSTFNDKGILAADLVTISPADLAALPTLKRSDLRQLWQVLSGVPMPPKASRDLLIYCLAYRIQEKACGGLSPAVRAQLRKLAQPLAAGLAPARASAPRLAPGTRLIRQWREQRHEVTVLEHGFAYRGGHYGSLSAIARIISGTHCSGPRFFGLTPKRASQSSAERAART